MSARSSEEGRRLAPVTVLLAAACLVSSLTLAASELMVTFEIVNPGGEPLERLEAADRHGYVMLVIAFFALFCLALAVLEGSKPAAVAVAVAGGLALLLFLIIDLPDAGQVGTVDDPVFFANAETQPQPGFWLELLGALSLAVSGAALATLRPDQLALRRGTDEARNLPSDEPAIATPHGGTVEPTQVSSRGERVSDRVERARRAARRNRPS